MRTYAYFYWIPVLGVLAWFTAPVILGAVLGAFTFNSIAHLIFSPVAVAIILSAMGIAVHQLRPSKPEALALMICGAIALAFFTLMQLMLWSLVAGMLAG